MLMFTRVFAFIHTGVAASFRGTVLGRQSGSDFATRAVSIYLIESRDPELFRRVGGIVGSAYTETETYVL